jgi:ACR3 family arsenite transporter
MPLVLYTYLIFALRYFGSKKLRIPYRQAVPTAYIGASNIFELAVAVSTILLGVHLGITLAINVGVLVEVPVMVSLVQITKRKKAKFQFDVSEPSNKY